MECAKRACRRRQNCSHRCASWMRKRTTRAVAGPGAESLFSLGSQLCYDPPLALRGRRRSMSDKPEEQQRKRQPSFEEVLQGVSTEEPKAAPKPPKKSAQPTFEEILESARPASEPSRPPAAERKSRPPRQKEERKMPIVVRKPTLGAPAPSEPPAAAAEAAERPAPNPSDDPGSVYAQPSPEENADFAALFAETEHEKSGQPLVGQR